MLKLKEVRDKIQTWFREEDNGFKDREAWFSNLKLIFLVAVFVGHRDFSVHNNAGFINFIYTWQMPGFALISGYFTRIKTDESWWEFFKNNVLPFLLAFVCMKTIDLGCAILCSKTSGHFGVYTPSSAWYLLALAVWKTVLYVIMQIEKIKGQKIKPLALITISFILALNLVFTENASAFITRFPYFLIGYYLAVAKIDLLKIRLQTEANWFWSSFVKLMSIAIIISIAALCIGNDMICITAYNHLLETALAYLLGTIVLVGICLTTPTGNWKLFGINLTKAGTFSMYGYMLEPVFKKVYTAYILPSEFLRGTDAWAGEFWPWFYGTCLPYLTGGVMATETKGAIPVTFTGYLTTIINIDIWSVAVNLIWTLIGITILTSLPVRKAMQWAWAQKSAERYTWFWRT